MSIMMWISFIPADVTVCSIGFQITTVFVRTTLMYNFYEALQTETVFWFFNRPWPSTCGTIKRIV